MNSKKKMNKVNNKVHLDLSEEKIFKQEMINYSKNKNLKKNKNIKNLILLINLIIINLI